MLTNTNLFLELCLIHSFDHLPSFEKEKKQKKALAIFFWNINYFSFRKKVLFLS